VSDFSVLKQSVFLVIDGLFTEGCSLRVKKFSFLPILGCLGLLQVNIRVSREFYG